MSLNRSHTLLSKKYFFYIKMEREKKVIYIKYNSKIFYKIKIPFNQQKESLYSNKFKNFKTVLIEVVGGKTPPQTCKFTNS